MAFLLNNLEEIVKETGGEKTDFGGYPVADDKSLNIFSFISLVKRI